MVHPPRGSGRLLQKIPKLVWRTLHSAKETTDAYISRFLQSPNSEAIISGTLQAFEGEVGPRKAFSAGGRSFLVAIVFILGTYWHALSSRRSKLRLIKSPVSETGALPVCAGFDRPHAGQCWCADSPSRVRHGRPTRTTPMRCRSRSCSPLP